MSARHNPLICAPEQKSGKLDSNLFFQILNSHDSNNSSNNNESDNSSNNSL